MTNENQYLPQHTLAQLSEQVCMKLPYFTNKFKIENIWDGIFPYCLLIEKDPRNVNIVTAEVSKHSEFYVRDAGIRESHVILVRIYILLYYKHRDNSVFQSIVFQELISRMGVYSKVENLKTIIHDRIDRILEQDKQIEASKEEARKNPKPMFTYVPHSGTESDYLYVEYNEEELFRHMSRIIKELAERHDVHLDEADVWYNAKQVVHSLRDIKRPELMIERVASALVPGQIHNEHKGSQIILLSAYMMVRATREHSHFDNFIKKMESYALDDSFKWTVLQNIKPVKKWLDENLPLEEEWDYIGETPIRETFPRADMERVLAEYKGQIESLKKEKESQDRQVQELLAKLKDDKTKYQDLENKFEELQKQASTSQSSTTVETRTTEALTLLMGKENEEYARNFVVELKGRDNVKIADLLKSYEDKFSPKVNITVLWCILYVSSYYSAGLRNLSSALRDRKFQE